MHLINYKHLLHNKTKTLDKLLQGDTDIAQ